MQQFFTVTNVVDIRSVSFISTLKKIRTLNTSNRNGKFTRVQVPVIQIINLLFEWKMYGNTIIVVYASLISEKITKCTIWKTS